MYTKLLATMLAAVAFALPSHRYPTCREMQLPVSVSLPRFIINATVKDNWDAVSFTFNLTRRDSTSPADPLPISGITPNAVNSTYQVGATVCGHGGPTLILTHGIIESKLYWRPTFENSHQYSFVDAAVAAGYSVISYDRIGVGSSSRVSALEDAQFQVEVAVLSSLVDYARNTLNATRVGLIGHSYGSYITAASASENNVDAVILTGFSGTFDYFGPFVAGAGFRVAQVQDPLRWASLDSAYLTSSDLYAETYAYFATPYFEHHVAEWSYHVGSEPFALAELPTVLSTTIDYEAIKGSVLIIQGQYDVSACGGNCVGLLEDTAALFTSAKVVETVDNLPAGHNLNLHKVAPKAFRIMLGFLHRHGM
ncbi:alpha/beta-hydrolase [Astrocystis sublimbata]|nr:alpha/beta-hydrolase [Astrocystis sublimbata]